MDQRDLKKGAYGESVNIFVSVLPETGMRALVNRAVHGDRQSLNILMKLLLLARNTVTIDLVRKADLGALKPLFVSEIRQGNADALFSLIELVQCDPSIPSLISTLDLKKLIDKGDPDILKAIIASGNRTRLYNDHAYALAAQRFFRLGGLQKDHRVLTFWASGVMNGLRRAHLERNVSELVLGKMLSRMTMDDPALLYLAYLPSENFNVMNKMILQRLKTAAAKDGCDLNEFLLKIDPREVLYKRFLFQAANFGHLSEFLSLPRSFDKVMGRVFGGLSDDDLRASGLMLSVAVEGIVKDGTFGEQKKFQAYLMGAYSRTGGMNKKFLALLLGLYRQDMVFLDRDMISRIVRQEKVDVPSASRIPYAKFVNRNNDIVFHVIFSDKDAVNGYFYQTALLFQGKTRFTSMGGYRLVPSESTAGRLTLRKGNIVLVLINGLKQPYAIDQEIGNIAGVMSRGHSGSAREKVFVALPLGMNVKDKMFLLSECRSLIDFGHMIKYYPGAAFIAGKGDVRGDRSNAVLYWLMEAFSSRVPTYEGIRGFMAQHAGKNVMDGYVFPGDTSAKGNVWLQGRLPVKAVPPGGSLGDPEASDSDFAQDVGGIDFDPSRMAFELRGDGAAGVPVADMALGDSSRELTGLVPVIISIHNSGSGF